MLLILLLSIVSHFPDWPHYPPPADYLVPCVTEYAGVCIENTLTDTVMLFTGFGLTFDQMEAELAPGGLYHQEWERATDVPLVAGGLTGLLGGNDPFSNTFLYQRFHYYSHAYNDSYAMLNWVYVSVVDNPEGAFAPWRRDMPLPQDHDRVPHVLNPRTTPLPITETPEGSSLLLVGLGLLILAVRRKSLNRTR